MGKLSPVTPVIHSGAEIVNSQFGAWCEVGALSRVINSTFEDYAYCDRMADIANTTVGKFSNIAAMTRIGPTDHPFANAAQHHFLYRSSYYWDVRCRPRRAPHHARCGLLDRPWRDHQA